MAAHVGEEMNEHSERRDDILTNGIRLDDFLPYLLNRITNRLNLDLMEAWRGTEMTTQYYRVLAVLKARNGRSIGELAVYTVTEQSTLSRIIDRMEQEGLVERRAGPKDGRVVEVFLTPTGRETIERILPIALEHYRRAVAGLSDSEVKTLTRILSKVLENIRRSPYS